MYEYIIGTVSMVTPNYVVLDNQGIGYRIQTSNPYQYQEGQKNVKIFIYQAVKEDSLDLFGFPSQEEKALFTSLISISGIGPKSALAILANPDHQRLLDAIANEDTNYLSHFPKIGKKTASRIIIELHDKISDLTSNNLFDESSAPTSLTNSDLKDALAALSALGYRQREVDKVKKALQNKPGLTTDEYLRQGLKILN